MLWSQMRVTEVGIRPLMGRVEEARRDLQLFDRLFARCGPAETRRDLSGLDGPDPDLAGSSTISTSAFNSETLVMY